MFTETEVQSRQISCCFHLCTDFSIAAPRLCHDIIVQVIHALLSAGALRSSGGVDKDFRGCSKR